MRKPDDSAQMIMIAGFAIGLSIVVLTLLLNNMIYASNTASESSIETNVFDISDIIRVTVDAHEKAYESASNGSFNETEYNNYLDTYSLKMSEVSAFTGIIYTLENGTFQEPYFTQNGLDDGEENWKVIERINNTDSFLMAINTSSMINSSDNFTVLAVNQSGTIWSAYFFKSGGGVNVTVTDGTSVLNSGDSATGELNITADLMDGSSSFNYYFTSRTAGQTYSINIANGNLSTGTFLLAGNATNGNSFEIERIKVVEATININKNGNLQANFVIPILLPKGQT